MQIQNNVSIYQGVELGDDVFCGPSCVFTNLNSPRADVSRKDEFRPTPIGLAQALAPTQRSSAGIRGGSFALSVPEPW